MTNNSRLPLAVGNWKLHKTIGESLSLVQELKRRIGDSPGCEVVVAPVFTALSAVREALAGSQIGHAAQNVFWETHGAFTGEVSAPLLKDLGCSYVIVGHSERRQLFGETDTHVRKKVRAVLDCDMAPIVCVGETLDERKSGETLGRILSQIDAALDGLEPKALDRVVIAYEPIWAIGTGVTASPEDAEEAQAAIRKRVANTFGGQLAEGMRILYGGSVKPENAASLMKQPDVDGALVGGASLTPDSFAAIVRAAR